MSGSILVSILRLSARVVSPPLSAGVTHQKKRNRGYTFEYESSLCSGMRISGGYSVEVYRPCDDKDVRGDAPPAYLNNSHPENSRAKHLNSSGLLMLNPLNKTAPYSSSASFNQRDSGVVRSNSVLELFVDDSMQSGHCDGVRVALADAQ